MSQFFKMLRWTYVERFSQNDPSRFRQDGEILQILRIVGRQIVDDGAVVVGIFVRRRHAQDVGPDIRVLFDILNIFL